MVNLPLLLGHRGSGVTRSVPENTFASFDLALEHGSDGFEFDVRLTRTGCGVVCHDPKVGRLLIERATYHQLSKLPRLEEVLMRYGQRVFLDIELKVNGLEPVTLAALRERPPARDFVVSSFLPGVLMEMQARSNHVPLGLICQTRSQLLRWRDLPVDYVIAHYSLIKPALVENLHASGKKIIAWTVNRISSMERFAQWKVDGIISADRIISAVP